MDLRAEALGIRYGARTVLEPTDCHVPPGTQALVLGRSGSGKTTLLKAFAGLLLPSSGRVTWDGQDVARLSAPERRAQQASFGFVFQTDALFDSLTVRQNVMQPLLRRRVPEAEARERTDAVLHSVGLGDAADTLPSGCPEA